MCRESGEHARTDEIERQVQPRLRGEPSALRRDERRKGEKRGLVQRLPDPVDTRAKNARLTPAGLDVLRAALKTHFDGVERVFFDRLAEEDIETLARVFEAFRR
jgi:hypothetical protein